MDDFENVEVENCTQLNDLTKALDHLRHKVDATEGLAYRSHKLPRMWTS